jgi:hypothetical protein
MSTNDYIKFLTQQLVQYMDIPSTERKQQRKMKKNNQSPFSHRWFGIIPFSVKMLFKKNNR